MPIWEHVLELVAALVSLILMPYVLIAACLVLATGWHEARRRHKHL